MFVNHSCDQASIWVDTIPEEVVHSKTGYKGNTNYKKYKFILDA